VMLHLCIIAVLTIYSFLTPLPIVVRGGLSAERMFASTATAARFLLGLLYAANCLTPNVEMRDELDV
jgi:hypothetical protein